MGLRIVLLSDWHSEKMGYSDNVLPKVLAALGHEVHLLSSNGQVYFNSREYRRTFEPFLGPGVVECGVWNVDGYTLHRLPYKEWRGRIGIRGLRSALNRLRPQIVQSGELVSLVTLEAALSRRPRSYKLFAECHIHASVFPPALRPGGRQALYWRLYSATVGRLIGAALEKCYPISSDAAEIAVRFCGVPEEKIEVRSLGVDADLFKPPEDVPSREARRRLREQLGFSPADIVCIYTGRFANGKAVRCLAEAIARLVAEGERFRALFVGNGARDEVDAILRCAGCVVHEFVPARELARFYWAADIGVWPTQESTSQLDAAACGLPLILSDRVKVLERVERNGLLYREGDVEDLARQIRALASEGLRRRMGEHGARKMREQFSWKVLAERYIRDYEVALSQPA